MLYIRQAVHWEALHGWPCANPNHNPNTNPNPNPDPDPTLTLILRLAVCTAGPVYRHFVYDFFWGGGIDSEGIYRDWPIYITPIMDKRNLVNFGPHTKTL